MFFLFLLIFLFLLLAIWSEKIFLIIVEDFILFIDTKKIVFSQTPYFSSRARKTIFRAEKIFNLRGAQKSIKISDMIKNPTRPGIYSRVLDIDNCVSYVTYFSQFSICITANICNLSHAVIHSKQNLID